jgi:thiamine-phosphate pyrophosphorylase
MRVQGLYAVTPDEANIAMLADQVRAAVAGGARFVQYRNKVASPALRQQQAAVLMAICRDEGAALIINDHLNLALEIGADGVHLGRGDGDVAHARATLGPDKILGVSCYNMIRYALNAQEHGADYVAFGSFFLSNVKPGAVRAPVGLLTQAKRLLSIPVVAIGGISLDNAAALIAAGADSVAVISALFGAPDISVAAKRFCNLFRLVP